MHRSFASLLARPAVAAGACVFFSLVASAQAADVDAYRLARTFALPTANAAAQGTVLFDALPDGRLVALNGADVAVETGVGSGAFAPAGSVSGFAPAFGASFLAVSPDGSRAAAGSNGGSITVFETANPSSATTFAVADFDAAWIDDARLAVSNFSGTTSGVQVLNTRTAAVSTVVTNVGGASAGVAFDAAGNLYTGNGFDGAGASDTGWVKAFTPAQVAAALATGTPIDFEAGGTPVVDLLAASAIGFDASGNLFVGGGDFYGGSGDLGYAAVVDADAILAALASGSSTPPIDRNAPSSLLRKFASPQATIDAAQAPLWTYNDATDELYLRYYGNGDVQVFVVPEPSALAVIGLAAAAFVRRRRRAIAATVVASTGAIAAGVASAAYTFDANDFAVEVVGSTNLPATGLYNDPQAVLGRPTLRFNNSSNPNVTDLRRAKLIEGTFNTGPGGQKLLTTISSGASVTVRMGRPVTDDAANPFGVDFVVFGNAFFNGTGAFIGDDANLNAFTLSGGLFAEPTKVSVSPDNVNWYRYESGPFADAAFPTNGFLWDSTAAAWTDVESDPTLPVDPARLAQVAGKTAATVLDTIYRGSAGGTGFDLRASGFDAINFVRLEGLTGFSGGEVDAIADVEAIVPEPTTIALLALPLMASRRRR